MRFQKYPDTCGRGLSLSLWFLSEFSLNMCPTGISLVKVSLLQLQGLRKQLLIGKAVVLETIENNRAN